MPRPSEAPDKQNPSSDESSKEGHPSHEAFTPIKVLMGSGKNTFHEAKPARARS